MSQLIQAFINATDAEGNTARINIAKITRIEGRCPPKEYDKDDGNRCSLRSAEAKWSTRETPEDIYERVLCAQQEHLKKLKATRLINQDSLMSFNVFARFRDDDDCVNYIPTNSIIRMDDEYSLVGVITQHHGRIECLNSLKELDTEIESAERTHIKMLQKYTLGIK
jgi:hypothetical protein